VVRRTGGLADSVQPYAADKGTGFLFDEPSAGALAGALSDAFAVYRDREAWRALQARCMAQDVSWERAGRRYVELYERAIALHAEGAK
jgi:starch synthase